MKKAVLFFLTFVIAFTLCACGIEKQSITIVYGDSETVSLSKGYTDVSWESSDNTIASVCNGIVKGEGPGTTVVSATRNGKTIAEISVSVNLVDITEIFLNQEVLELSPDETSVLKYSLIPETASDYGLSWKSVNDDIATVDTNGNISAVSPGTTTIICASPTGVISTCEVIVKTPSAIDLLNEDELRFYSYLVNEVLPTFYNASAMRLRGLYAAGKESTPTIFYADVQGTNRLGGTIFNNYSVMLIEDTGLFLECGSQPDLSIPFDASIIDYVKINSALEEYWSGNSIR